MNDKPAGAHGFVQVDGPHFRDGAGKQIRFWGASINFSGAFPDKDVATKVAARLAKFGFNSVRLHDYEGYVAPGGLWEPAEIGSSRPKVPRQVDPDQLDKFDYLVSELIKQGIYVDLCLHVGRIELESEGFPNAAQLPDHDKGIGDFYPPMTATDQAFARGMLLHLNPYTGHRYCDEPGLCCIEVANENSLLSVWLDGTLDKLPSPYNETLRAQWNAWLKTNYGSDDALRRAWTEFDVPLSSVDLLAVPPPGLTPGPAPSPSGPESEGSANGTATPSTPEGAGAAGVQNSAGGAANPGSPLVLAQPRPLPPLPAATFQGKGPNDGSNPPAGLPQFPPPPQVAPPVTPAVLAPAAPSASQVVAVPPVTAPTVPAGTADQTAAPAPATAPLPAVEPAPAPAAPVQTAPVPANPAPPAPGAFPPPRIPPVGEAGLAAPEEAGTPDEASTAAKMAGLRLYQLALVGGADGRLELDETGGPTVDGLVQPGLAAQLATAGNVSWAFQVNRDGIPLEEGQVYTLTFWARSDTPRQISANAWLDHAPFRFLGFTGYANLTSDWQKFSFSFHPTGTDPGSSRITFNLGNQVGTVELGDISVVNGGHIAAPDDWNLIDGVPLILSSDSNIPEVRRDFCHFLGDMEAAHLLEMRRFLKQDLGVHIPIWQTQAEFGGWGGLMRETNSDVIDNHAYWRHPDLGPLGWSGTEWKVVQASMATEPDNDPLAEFALARLYDKPYVLTEWNSGQPSDYGGESLIMAAAYAARQDWSGIWIFDYHSYGDYDRDHFDGFFSIDSVPVKMTTAALAALVFRRPTAEGLGDIDPAPDAVKLHMPLTQVWDEVSTTPGPPSPYPFMKTWAAVGVPRGTSLEQQAGVEWGSGLFASPSTSTLEKGAVENSQVHWDSSRRLWTVNTPRTRLVVGYVGGQIVNLGELRMMFDPDSKWAAGGLVSLDGKDLPNSHKMLLVLTGKVENIDMKWNAGHDSVGASWGHGPTYVEGIGADIRLLTNATGAEVWSLDETGQRLEHVPCSVEDGVLRFSASPTWRTLWYEIDPS